MSHQNPPTGSPSQQPIPRVSFKTQSEADLALSSKLAFWSGDSGQVDHLFRASGLYRAKWDEPHFKVGDATISYGQATITKAFAGKKEFYSPPTPPTYMGSLARRTNGSDVGVEPQEDDSDGRRANKRSAADVIIQLVLESGAELFRDERNSRYIAFDNPGGRREVSPIKAGQGSLSPASSGVTPKPLGATAHTASR